MNNPSWLSRSLAPATAALLLAVAGCRGCPAPGHSVAWTSGGIILLRGIDQDVDTIGRGFYPALSPDASRVACVRDDPGSGTSSIVLIDTATGTEQTILESPEALMDLSWSPDGRVLAFVTASLDGSRAIEICAPDGSCRASLCSGSGRQGLVILRPTWLPDSRGLLYSDESGLRRVLLDGTSQSWIPLESITHSGSALSPSDRFAVCPADSTLIAYTRTIPATTRLTVETSVASTHSLFVYDCVAGTSLQMTASDMCALDPVWASDGSAILFWGYDPGMAREGAVSVYCLDYASGRCEAVAPGQSPTVD